MSYPPFPVPIEVTNWVRTIFGQVNERTSKKLSRIPTTHETSLDLTIIEQLSQYAAPFRFQSDWLVRLDTHYLGGPRYWGKWEIADIGILIVFRRKSIVEATKIALLQSKRLYPIESYAPSEDHSVDFEVGFGRLLESEQQFKSLIKKRRFSFAQESHYRALEFRGEQYDAILEYSRKEGVPVHYLLHHPLSLPSTTELPAEADDAKFEGLSCELGSRVIGAEALDLTLRSAKLKKGSNPSFEEIAGRGPTLDDAFWKFEHFVADLVLGCKEGYRGGTSPMEDQKLFRVFNRRSGPVSAAISITVDAPAGG